MPRAVPPVRRLASRAVSGVAPGLALDSDRL